MLKRTHASHPQIRKITAGDLTPDVMLGRQTLLNCAPFHNMSQGCDGAAPRAHCMNPPHGARMHLCCCRHRHSRQALKKGVDPV